MDLITELENEFAALSEDSAPDTISVKVVTRELQLRLPQLGLDYLAGLSAGTVVIIPKRNISAIHGTSLPLRRKHTLEQFLAYQRTPIRVRLNTGSTSQHCWLLNLQPGWLRVTTSEGLAWVPIEAVELMEIVAVDNSNH
jgi:hypothetical protein